LVFGDLGFLEAKDVGTLISEPLGKSLPVSGSETVDVPGQYTEPAHFGPFLRLDMRRIIDCVEGWPTWTELSKKNSLDTGLAE
jgi:hypothetical protein